MTPYISFVVVSRNDNHGGDLNARTQAFISGLITQSQRHKVPIELVMVEWNPPADRPPLSQIYDWGSQRDYCDIRVITVPRELHDTFAHSKAQALYQMIGKNAGIRRAKGEFIAATNIDIIFDDNIFKLFSERKIRAGTCYVCDRIDVSETFPYSADFDEQLRFCRSNILRLHGRYGSTIMSTGELVRIYSEERPWKLAASASVKGLRDASNLARTAVVTNVKDTMRLRKHEMTHYVPWLWGRFWRAGVNHIPYSEFKAQLQHYLRDVRGNHSAFLRTYRRNMASQIYSTFDAAKHRVREALGPWHQLRLQTNACGDFTLMDRQSWNKIHGYAEYDMYSMHIDSLAVWASHSAGIPQTILEGCSIYHIEHGAGSGFTPEYQEQLWSRLRARHIPFLEWPEFYDLIVKLVRGDVDYRLNPATWGFAGQTLPEVPI